MLQKYKHNLIKEFPEQEERIHELKDHDETFKMLAKEYHSLDHRISGLHSNGIPASDEYYESLKLRRVQLKDQLFRLLSK